MLEGNVSNMCAISSEMSRAYRHTGWPIKNVPNFEAPYLWIDPTYGYEIFEHFDFDLTCDVTRDPEVNKICFPSTVFPGLSNAEFLESHSSIHLTAAYQIFKVNSSFLHRYCYVM